VGASQNQSNVNDQVLYKKRKNTTNIEILMKMQVRCQKREKACDQSAICFDFASNWFNKWCDNNNLYSCPEIILYEGKEHSRLEIAKLIELSGWTKCESWVAPITREHLTQLQTYKWTPYITGHFPLLDTSHDWTPHITGHHPLLNNSHYWALHITRHPQLLGTSRNWMSPITGHLA